MKKFVAVLLALVLVLGMMSVASADKLSEIQAKGKLVLGTSVSFPPYEFYWTNPETGVEEVSGFEMELAKAIAAKIGVELEIVDQSFAGLITALNTDELDMTISGMSIKPERQEVVDFSDPYFSGTQILAVRAEDADKYKTVEDMAGKTIGVQTGSLQAGIREAQFANSNELSLGEPAVLAMELKNGNIDGWLITDVVIKQYMSVYPDTFVISEVPVEYTSAGVAAAVNKGNDNESLLALVNEVIAEVKADGTFQTWFDEACAKAASLLAAN